MKTFLDGPFWTQLELDFQSSGWPTSILPTNSNIHIICVSLSKYIYIHTYYKEKLIMKLQSSLSVKTFFFYSSEIWNRKFGASDMQQCKRNYTKMFQHPFICVCFHEYFSMTTLYIPKYTIPRIVIYLLPNRIQVRSGLLSSFTTLSPIQCEHWLSKVKSM